MKRPRFMPAEITERIRYIHYKSPMSCYVQMNVNRRRMERNFPYKWHGGVHEAHEAAKAFIKSYAHLQNWREPPVAPGIVLRTRVCPKTDGSPGYIQHSYAVSSGGSRCEFYIGTSRTATEEKTLQVLRKAMAWQRDMQALEQLSQETET